MNSFHLTSAATVALACLGPAASAGLVGSELVAEWHFLAPPALESHIVAVGSEIELAADVIVNDDKFAIDIGNDTISFIFNHDSQWWGDGFNGWMFTDLNGTVDTISGYEVLSYEGLGTPVVSTDWSDDSFWAGFSGSEFFAGDILTLQVSFVPAPGVVTLLGFSGLLAARRRRF